MTKKTNPESSGQHAIGHDARMPMKDYPPLVHRADKASLEGQARYLSYIRSELLIAVFAALFSDLIHVRPEGWKIAGWSVVVLLIVGLIVQLVRLGKRQDQGWFEGRAVAESGKTLTWRFMMKVHPFHDESNLETEFMNRLRSVVHGCRVSQPKTEGSAEEITQRMRETRGYPWEKRRDFYVAARLNDQIKWYLGKAKYNSRRSRRWLAFSIFAQICAIGAAFLAIYSKEHWNFVPFVTTIAASFVAWSQAKNFDELSESYDLAHDELSQIKEDQILRATSEAAFLDAVVNSEGAISREHTMWAARSGSPVVWKIA